MASRSRLAPAKSFLTMNSEKKCVTNLFELDFGIELGIIETVLLEKVWVWPPADGFKKITPVWFFAACGKQEIFFFTQ